MSPATNRREFLKTAIPLAAWPLGGIPRAGEPPGPRPNVLLILADDLGYSDLGCYGGEIPTPSVDRLADGGVRFTRFYNSARCCPSRASLMTGLHPHQAGIGSFTTARPDTRRGPAYLGHLNDRCVTLAEVLRAAGYGTYMVGKWHLGEPGPIARGFDEFYGFVDGHSQDQWSPDRYRRLPEDRTPEKRYPEGEFYATDAFNDYAVEFLNQARRRDRPWFLYLAHSAPHFPVQAPRASADRFVDTYRRGWDVLREERFARMRALGLATDAWTLTPRSLVPQDRDDIANGYPGKPNPAWADLPEDRREDLARRMAVFAAMVTHIDAGVGRIVQTLRQSGDLENTLILFLSDNGACYEWGPFGFDGRSRAGETRLHRGDELLAVGGPGTHHSYGSAWANLGNTPFRLYKHFTHEGGICTPCIAHWPGGIAHPDRWARDPAHVMDILPTVCEVAAAPYPETVGGAPTIPVEGISLTPVFRDGKLPERALGFEHQEARALSKGRWKVVWGKRMPEPPRWELYDLETDRCETTDLAAAMPDRTRELADEWDAWARRVKVYPFFRPEPQENASPLIAGRPFTVSCNADPESRDGVILAQGGDRHGYALYLADGRLKFSVRIDGDLTVITAEPTPDGRLAIEAGLGPDGAMTLTINGTEAARGRAPGLIPVQPLDELSIGLDSHSAAGDYTPPNPLRGTVRNVRIVPR